MPLYYHRWILGKRGKNTVHYIAALNNPDITQTKIMFRVSHTSTRHKQFIDSKRSVCTLNYCYIQIIILIESPKYFDSKKRETTPVLLLFFTQWCFSKWCLSSVLYRSHLLYFSWEWPKHISYYASMNNYKYLLTVQRSRRHYYTNPIEKWHSIHLLVHWLKWFGPLFSPDHIKIKYYRFAIGWS